MFYNINKVRCYQNTAKMWNKMLCVVCELVHVLRNSRFWYHCWIVCLKKALHQNVNISIYSSCDSVTV